MKIRKTSFPFFYCYWYKNQTSVRPNQIKTYARFSLPYIYRTYSMPQILTVPLASPLAKYFPSGLHSTEVTL